MNKCALTIHYDNIANINSESQCEQLQRDYSDVFDGKQRTLPGQIHLEVDETVTPHTMQSQMVIATKKSDDLRICIDSRSLKRAPKRERYQLPTLEYVLPKLTNAKYSSKVDVASTYWHSELNAESSYHATFQTGFSRCRWLRLPFGILRKLRNISETPYPSSMCG